MTAAIAFGVSGRAGSARADEPCPPAAIVTGDRELAQQIGADLERRGVARTAPAGCPQVTAAVSRDGELVRLEVTDDYGRSRTWEVRDVTTVSALIESWTRQEIDESELPPEEPVVPPKVVAAAPVAAVEDAVVPVAATSRARGVATAAFESATAGETPWFGGSAGGCMRLSRLCVGGRVRGARSTPTHHDMTAIDLLAAVDVPISIGGFELSPGVVVGLGWTRVTTDDPHALDPSMDIGGLRAGVQVAIARPIVGGFGVELALSFDGILLGQSDAPTALPRGLARAGLGLRYGGR